MGRGAGERRRRRLCSPGVVVGDRRVAVDHSGAPAPVGDELEDHDGDRGDEALATIAGDSCIDAGATGTSSSFVELPDGGVGEIVDNMLET